MRSSYKDYYPLHYSWKRTRCTKYRPGKRGKKHVYLITDKRTHHSFWYNSYIFTKYCKAHDIPCEVRELRHNESRWEYKRTWQLVGYRKTWQYKKVISGEFKKKAEYIKVDCLQPNYDWVYDYDAPLVKRTWSVTDGTELIWWSDKDIGIEYILKKAAY